MEATVEPTRQPDPLVELRTRLVAAVRRAVPESLRPIAEDLVQDAVLKVLANIGPDADLNGAYVKRLAWSVVCDELRRRKVRPEDPDEDIAMAPSTTERGPEARAMDAQTGLAVKDCIGALADARRQAVTLHLLGHSARETARAMRCTIKRAENLTYRGLDQVRSCLRAKGIEP